VQESFSKFCLKITNHKSPIANIQFFVLPLRLDSQQKTLVIGEWRIAICYLRGGGRSVFRNKHSQIANHQ